MLSKTARAALFDFRQNILAPQGFVAGLTFKQFSASKLHYYAVIRALEIISEAARHLPEDFRRKHQSLPWKQIMVIGNVFRHNYDDIVEAIVWETVHEHLGPLLVVINAEIARLDDGK